ncbi:MAG: tetratricopeptide repeat protein [Phycisphaerales bacterium]|nr:tetratricopeptide repeat protein [Phycisphaerales bacterium]
MNTTEPFHHIHKDVNDANPVWTKIVTLWHTRKSIITNVLIVLVLICLAIWGYYHFVQEPKETKANALMFGAKKYFSVDSFRLALNGDGINKGFSSIAQVYSGTKAGNLSNYYAGLCCLHLGEFKNAVTYLKKFSTGAQQIQMFAYGSLADAYSELGNNNDAITYYKKAGTTFPKDEKMSAEYLFRAGLLSEAIGNTKQAIEYYQLIQHDYPITDRGFQINKYIYRLKYLPNDYN